MKDLTRNGICYNLRKSPYRIKLGSRIVLYFSSELNKTKFLNREKQHRDKINESLTNRFGVLINCDILGFIQLYTQIEKRGFYMLLDGEEILCKDNLRLDGARLNKIS